MKIIYQISHEIWTALLVAMAIMHPATNSQDIHGGVKMGVPNDECDNAEWNIKIDWDSHYLCRDNEKLITSTKQAPPVTECLDEEDIPRPLHECMDVEIKYDDIPPRGGPHRPLWPVYGEYEYIPPQRWVHALEHGAAVFLYHPCADPEQIERLRNIAQSCLRKYIITPYRPLSRKTPFAVVTYGCRLMMTDVDVTAAKDFVKKNALTAPESGVASDGHYSYGLIKQSEEASDHKDSNLCPANTDWLADNLGLQIAESMSNDRGGNLYNDRP